jgi:hypothetical protein
MMRFKYQLVVLGFLSLNTFPSKMACADFQRPSAEAFATLFRIRVARE